MKCVIEGVQLKGVGTPYAFSGSILNGFPDFGPVQVVGQTGDICTVVIEDSAVGGDPGDPGIVVPELTEGGAFHVGIHVFGAGIGGLEDACVGQKARV